MKKSTKMLIVPVLAMLLLGINSCKKNDPVRTQVKTHTIAVNWFRDSTTTNPTAFIDFYNGVAYTQSNAQTHAASIDAFCFDRSQLIVSATEVDMVNMVNFGNSNYAAYDAFNAVVGTGAFSTYTSSTFSEIAMTPVEFNNITYNTDIAQLFSDKGLNGGYGDMAIQSSDLTNTSKYYQFVCSTNGKRGFFHVTSSNYLPGGTMSIEVKVEQ